MNINEVTNLNAVITVADSNGNNIPVINLYANIDGTNMNINITTNTVNAAMSADTNNAASIQSQYSQFYTTVQTKAKDLGFTIFA